LEGRRIRTMKTGVGFGETSLSAMLLRNSQKTLMTCPKCNAPLIPKPVPGALKYPQRLECPVHGWLPERITPIRMRFHKDRPDW
jgi:hypothetical protein